MIAPPTPAEHDPYWGRYIALAGAGDVLETLRRQAGELAELLTRLTEEQSNHSYAPGKWTVKEVIGHLSDTERIFAYRALRVARNDTTNLPGFEQDDFVRNANSNRRTLANLIDEFSSIRRATLTLLESLDEESWLRMGRANNKDVSVRALAFVMAGHVVHHCQQLQEKYLGAGQAPMYLA